MDDPKRREEFAHIHSRWLLNSAAIAVRQLDGFYKELESTGFFGGFGSGPVLIFGRSGCLDVAEEIGFSLSSQS